MELTRRDFLRATSAVAAALGVRGSGLWDPREALGVDVGLDGAPVVWLQAQCCSGCSVSLLNSIYYATAETLLVDTLDVKFHPTLMAAAADAARAAADAAYEAGGYILVVEGSIPTAERGEFCHLWPGMTALHGVKHFADRADALVAVGACACYGGVVGGSPNPTGAQGLGTYFAGKPVVNIPGCPVHPDWVVGTIAYMLANGAAPPLDGYGRPVEYFGNRIHRGQCPHFNDYRNGVFAQRPGDDGCLLQLGCKGHETMGDCPSRQWNAGGPQGSVDQYGVSWCVEAGAPCYGCTQPGFPDAMAPFTTIPAAVAAPAGDDLAAEADAPDADADAPTDRAAEVREAVEAMRDRRRRGLRPGKHPIPSAGRGK